jgi:hypothetical protein
MSLKSTTFWAVTPWSSETDRRFGGIYHFYLQGWRVSQGETSRTSFLILTELNIYIYIHTHTYTWNFNTFTHTSCSAMPPASADLLLGLLFERDDGGNAFLRNVRPTPNYMSFTSQKTVFFILWHVNPLLGNDLVNTCPRQRIRRQQSNNFRCYATAL